MMSSALNKMYFTVYSVFYIIMLYLFISNKGYLNHSFEYVVGYITVFCTLKALMCLGFFWVAFNCYKKLYETPSKSTNRPN